jgi:hypothetical protein
VHAPNDLDLIEQLLARAPVEVMKRLARHFKPWALRNCSLAERDTAYRDPAAYGAAGSGYAAAMAVIAEVERYRRGAWRFDRGLDMCGAFPHQGPRTLPARRRGVYVTPHACLGVHAGCPSLTSARNRHSRANGPRRA